MATQGSTYNQPLPSGAAKHRKHVAEMAEAAKNRRQEGKSTGRARNRARKG